MSLVGCAEAVVGPGAVIADRFVLGPELGAGGMGAVYRAYDRLTGASVAVKLMLSESPESAAGRRFVQEGAVLASLQHPGIVAYVAHGVTESGQLYLVMELLEGEDLGARLRRGALRLDETLLVVRQVALALEIAHQRGVVHRDLKPSNLFLRDGTLDRVVLLDFGIARQLGAGGLTRTGRVVGTPDYMAPEQARGADTLGPAADVFALGCLVFRCLTGRPPFMAEHVVATLARILFESPPALAELRPDLPEGVSLLVEQMLRKSPEERPGDATALLLALDRIGPLGDAGGSAPRSGGLSGAELELVSVLLIGSLGTTVSESRTYTEEDTFAELSLPSPLSVMQTLSARSSSAERLADGSIVATFLSRGGSAVDQAVDAATCAARVATSWPELKVAVATARQVSGAAVPIGDAIERAATLLSADKRPLNTDSGSVLLDDVTAGLLDGRMLTRALGDGRHVLARDTTTVDVTRPVLGKATPCVGRDQELGVLDMALNTVLEDGGARAVVVVGTPGIGKSRLRHEWLRRVARRREDGQPIRLLEGRAEMVRAGSPHGVVGDLLRRTFGIGPDDPPALSQQKLLDGAPTALGTDVGEMLGELAEVRLPDVGRVRLRSARQDPRLMQTRVTEAFVAFLRHLSENEPVLVVLEDLHWGDRGSIELFGAALRALSERPLLVVVFARPEIHELAPSMWKEWAIELPLRRLSRRVCELLVRRVAGDRIDAETVARLAVQSDGNALFLEELIRAACLGDTTTLPETVLAMLQTRIARLDSNARRTLRAASLFGEAFDAAGVRAVLGPATGEQELQQWLAGLRANEVLEADHAWQTASAHGPRFRFRHALMRDAAYGLMVPSDRRLGHQLAAEWLASEWLAGRGLDPGLIGEHFVLADRPDAAGPWLVQAADRALERDDYQACERISRRARESGVTGAALGALGVLESLTAVMRWDWTHAASLLEASFGYLEVGGRHWVLGQRTGAQLAAFRNDPAGLRSAVQAMLAVAPREDARVVYADSCIHMASSTIQSGSPELGRVLLARVESTSQDLFPKYPGLLAWYHLIWCTWHRHTDDALAAQLRRAREALRLYEEAGASRLTLVLARDLLGEIECRAGDWEQGLTRLRGSHADATEVGAGMILSHARLALANGLLSSREAAGLVEAEALAQAILATPGISAGFDAMARDVVAAARLGLGDLETAEREARAAIQRSPHTPVRRWLMVAHLGEVLLRRGRGDEAENLLDQALAEAEGGAGYAELPLLTAAARVREARRPGPEAATAWARVADYRARQAAAFDDPAAQARYLSRSG